MSETRKYNEERPERVPEQGNILDEPVKEAYVEDTVFGYITEDGPNFKSVLHSSTIQLLFGLGMSR